MDSRVQRKGLQDTPVRRECDIPGKCRYTLLNHHVFEVDEKYVPIKAIGKGAYGLVCSAENRETREKVAIKKIAGAFCNDVDAIRTLREINLLRHIEHDNVIAIRDIMSPANEKFEDVYIVYDCMDTDLHQIIRSSQPLSDDHFQFFIWQVIQVTPEAREQACKGIGLVFSICQLPREMCRSSRPGTNGASSTHDLVCNCVVFAVLSSESLSVSCRAVGPRAKVVRINSEMHPLERDRKFRCKIKLTNLGEAAWVDVIHFSRLQALLLRDTKISSDTCVLE